METYEFESLFQFQVQGTTPNKEWALDRPDEVALLIYCQRENKGQIQPPLQSENGLATIGN